MISLDAALVLWMIKKEAAEKAEKGGQGMKLALAGFSLFYFMLSTAAIAAETITYAYDTKGRLTKVEHAGSVNNGVRVDLTHDAADNRRNVKTTGASR